MTAAQMVHHSRAAEAAALLPHALAAAGFLLGHALAALVLAATAFVLGRTVIGLGRRLAGGPRAAAAEAEEGGARGRGLAGAAETFAVPATVGLAGLATLALLLGQLGRLARGPALVVLLAVHLLGLPVWLSVLRDLVAGLAGGGSRPGRLRWPSRGGGLAPAAVTAVATVGAGAVAFAPFWLLSLYPPTAFDATLYHLPYARSFVASGAVPVLPLLRYPVFPQLEEMLFAGMLLFGDDLAAQQVTALATLLTAILLFAWGRRAFSPAAGWLAAALFLGNPIVAYLAGTAYVEPGLVLFVTAALFALARWRATGGGGGRGWLALAALCAAAGACCKYPGLFFVAVVALAAVAGRPASSPATRPVSAAWRGERWRDLGIVVLVAALALAPWYGRIIAATGNPLFPFLPQIFGASPWAPAEFEIHGGAADLGGRLVRAAWALVRLPWDLVFARRRLGGLPPYSPVWLLLLPVLAATALRDSRARAALLVSGAYALVVLTVLPDARYLAPITPLASLVAAGGLDWLLTRHNPRARRLLLPLVASACLLPGWLYAGYRLWRQGPIPVTAEERERYLARELPLYEAIGYLNRTLGRGYRVYAIYGENMAYFAGGVVLGDWNGPAAYSRVIPGKGDPETLYRNLRRVGADHLLLVAGQIAVAAGDPSFGRLFRPVYADAHARLFALAASPPANAGSPRR